MNLRRAFDFRSSDAGLDAAKRMEWFYRLGYERRRLAKRCFSSNPGFSLKIVGQFSG
jgi:UDP-N-acetyl-D-mannosaminuronic acid transferase (WecB/TagA/CpsF family)